MSAATGKQCLACLRTDAKRFVDVRHTGSDRISIWEKFKVCFPLIEVEMEAAVCSLCVRLLKSSYKFHMLVARSQQALKSVTEEQKALLTENVKLEEVVKDEVVEEQQQDAPCSDNNNAETEEDDEEARPARRKRKPQVELELECLMCGIQFNKNWKLTKHMTRVHNETRKFECTYCHREFKQTCHLKEHITSHTGEKNYSCSICSKKFQRMSSMRRHIKAHDAAPGHKTKRTPFLCTICGKNFPFSNGVQRHMRIHLGIKNHQCPTCNRRFTQSTHLQVHMRTHTGEKPYICDICGEKFSLKSCMVKHMNNQHFRRKNEEQDMDLANLFKFSASDLLEIADEGVKNDFFHEKD